MPSTNDARRLLLTLALAVSAVAVPAYPAGFGIFEQGSKAMGMAGAFTAQADDPSAMFHNVGGLAFQTERAFQAGFTWIKSEKADFVGAPPFPGAGVTADQEGLSEFPPHFYWVEPVSGNMTFGLAVNSPFGLKSEWQDPDTFPGRFINTEASLTTLDLNPNLGIRLTPNLGIGLGAIIRFSEVELNNRQATPTPFGPIEFAAVGLESDLDEGFGWQFGLLHRYNESFSWGFSYRSKLTIEFQGDGLFRQVPTGSPILDGFVRQQFPFFDQALPVETEIEFPDMASFGVALALGPTTLMEVDVNWIGWSSFGSLEVFFPPQTQGLLDFERTENWDDAYNYRLGLLFGRGQARQWRFGYVYDETPQPEDAVSPLLPDADRQGITLGYGRQFNGKSLDLAVMYLEFDERTTTTSRDNFFGTYEKKAWLVGLTFGF